jgi:hypothetical protein
VTVRNGDWVIVVVIIKEGKDCGNCGVQLTTTIIRAICFPRWGKKQGATMRLERLLGPWHRIVSFAHYRRRHRLWLLCHSGFWSPSKRRSIGPNPRRTPPSFDQSVDGGGCAPKNTSRRPVHSISVPNCLSSYPIGLNGSRFWPASWSCTGPWIAWMGKRLPASGFDYDQHIQQNHKKGKSPQGKQSISSVVYICVFFLL